MQTVQIPGPLGWSKFVLVFVIWAMCLFAIGGVTITIHKQWPFVSSNADGNRDDQCESLNYTSGTKAGTVLEPENTWSNAGYLLAGMLILVCTHRPLGYILGVNLCVLAFFSGMYHGTLQGDWQTLDVVGIYMVLWVELLYSLQAVFLGNRLQWLQAPWNWLTDTVGAVMLGALFSLFGYYMGVHRTDHYYFGSTTVAFTLVTALVILMVFQMGRMGFNWLDAIKIWKLWVVPGAQGWDYVRLDRIFWYPNVDAEWNFRSYFWFFVLVGGPSILCRLGDGDGHFLCKPDWVVQPHSVWHVGGAATLLMGYDFFAWSSGWDYPVFLRRTPNFAKKNSFAIYGTVIAAAGFGIALVILSFVPKAFIDAARNGDPDSVPITTGVLIASFFLLVALTLLVLRAARVIDDPES